MKAVATESSLQRTKVQPRFFPLAGRGYDASAASGTERRSDGRAIDFATRTLIYCQGDLVDWIYQVTRGAVMLYKLLPDGRRQIVELLGPGDVFGYALTPVQECSAETLTATSCAAFDRAYVERAPDLERALNAHLYKQLCALQEHVALLGRKSAGERMASFLMRWVPGRGGYRCPGPRDGIDRTEFRLAMTRQEIADYLGLTIETVSRTLTKFKRRGIVAINKLDEICVRDICTLCRMTGTHLTHGQQCSAREQPLIKDPWP